MIREKKYAVCFPDMETDAASATVSIFTERSVQETQDTFLKTFSLFHSLSNYVIQRNRTRELGKQLDARKAALDVQVEQLRGQMEIEYAEESKRLQLRLKTEREQMELDFRRLIQETSAAMSDFSISVEEAMQKSQILSRIIRRERECLEAVQPYVECLADSYSRRREYVQYCEMQRKSYALIDRYLKEMI